MNGASDNPILSDDSELPDSPMDHKDFVDLSRDTDEEGDKLLPFFPFPRLSVDKSSNPTNSICPQNEVLKREYDIDDDGNESRHKS